ncbi:MAG TPA: hypothetical protein VI818_07205 [Candidatus Thermoplasmatota archaeon]|nr:hypothetical protein [Candidatus Thermoplasmatota archaeon]
MAISWLSDAAAERAFVRASKQVKESGHGLDVVLLTFAGFLLVLGAVSYGLVFVDRTELAAGNLLVMLGVVLLVLAQARRQVRGAMQLLRQHGWQPPNP